MKAGKKRNHYIDEFKTEAVSLVTDQGDTLTEAAQTVGVCLSNLRRWKRELEQEKTGERLKFDGREELARLRRENRQLRMEKEILKKASAFFVRYSFIKRQRHNFPIAVLCRVRENRTHGLMRDSWLNWLRKSYLGTARRKGWQQLS